MKYIEVDFNIEPLHPARDILVSDLADISFESFVETEKGLKAYVSFSDFSVMKLEGLPSLNHEDFQIGWTVNELPDQNWNEVWETSFEPIAVKDRCFVRAPFHDPGEGFAYEVVIEPKMSFGTGHHETTWQMIDRLFEMEVQNKSVLDMGCGTGVLAILCSKMGAGDITAIDIDDWSYRNTVENCKHNKTPEIEVILGDVGKLEERSFQLILANINKNVLLADIPSYVKALKPGGTLLMSGFFQTDIEDLVQATEAHEMRYLSQTVKNNWATVLCTKKEV